MLSAILLSTRDNVSALHQGRELLDRLEPQGYSRKSALCFNSSVGGHMRHVLDHYLSLLGGLPEGRIDYEARTRNAATETDPAHAAGLVESITSRLVTLTDDRALEVRSECAGQVWAGTSLLRELEFALSHTIHHFALIAVIASESGVKLPQDFGVAPSTLRHRASLQP